MATPRGPDAAGEGSPVGESHKRAKLIDHDVTSVRAALQQQETLVRILNTIGPPSRGPEGRFASCLRQAVMAAEHVREFFNDLQGESCFAMPPDTRAPLTAGKVFQLPELLERILLNLPAYSLLKAQEVNRTFAATIEWSKRLQQKLLQCPDPGAFYTPITPCYMLGFMLKPQLVGLPYERKENAGSFLLEIRVYDSGWLVDVKHGDRILSMLLCQPPIFELEARMTCRCGGVRQDRPRRHEPEPVTHTVTSKTGFTVGELKEAVKRLRQTHQLCPLAEPNLHDDQGFVRCEMTFSTPLNLKDDDPQVVTLSQRHTKESEASARREEMAARLRPYIAAKQEAQYAGEPIPTLAEFEASNADDADNADDTDNFEGADGADDTNSD